MRDCNVNMHISNIFSDFMSLSLFSVLLIVNKNELIFFTNLGLFSRPGVRSRKEMALKLIYSLTL